jgi:hypothetical protein
MDNRPERLAIPYGIESTDRVGGTRTEHVTHGLDRLHHRRHAAESEPGRDEGNEFTVFEPVVPPHNLDGIDRRLWMIERGILRVERRLERRDGGHGVIRAAGGDRHAHAVAVQKRVTGTP